MELPLTKYSNHKTWLRGQDLHLRLERYEPLVLSYATTAPQKHGPGGRS
jgi:hypothetical protein